ncbi:MAG: hypothetical protein K8R68_09305 [Bacteroidales bacterium]|nr:hypothetical protein [Bacteroidales bacterium]
MKKFLKYAIILAILPMLFLTNCKKDKDPVEPERQTDAEFQTLVTYLKSKSMDLNNILDGWITTAENVNTNINDGDDTNDYFIIDIRAADAYTAGHITTAVNSTLGNVLTTAEGCGEKTIVVACVTGQTAGHAVCALRLSGYADAKVLKWGMSGWHSSLSASWTNNTGDAAVNHANWTVAPGALVDAKEFDDPDLAPTATAGAEILAERVTAMLTEFSAVTNDVVLGSPGSYFINNYWDAADVEKYGHIKGAYRINPLTLSGEEYFNLDPSKTIVTYCWTGQTSSVVTAYLKVLGYTAKSLKFGVNSMIHTPLESHKWDASAVIDYDLVP